MAKKKAPAPWSINTGEAKKAAKSSIQETSNLKPKKKVGRPLEVEEEKVRVLIGITARNYLRRIAAIEGESMGKYLTDLILKDAKEKGIFKE